jgi:hypothetical protein
MSEAAGGIESGTTIAAETVAPELGRLGRIAVIGIVIAGAAVTAPSGIGLVWYIPFAGVGALLAIRRPGTSIGWILLALAWLTAIIWIPVERDQFTDVTVSWPLRLFALVHGASGPLTFLLLAVLAVVFPSGRLPTGRWGTVVRVALVSGAAVVLAAPILMEATSTPIMALALGAVISLGVRYRRAHGVERQQLRWLVAALVFFVVAVMAGFVIYDLVPGADESWLAWILAILALPCVPLAIGIAVLRYRLYEIDTVINRALVYGSLTAIVAGVYTASIALMQRLFVTVTGETSDAAIVLTTLVVVVGFTPLKTRLQAIVDRRYKEVPDPASALEAFVTEVRHALSPPDRDRTMRRLTEVAVESYQARGGEVQVRVAETPTRPITVGTMTDPLSHQASATAGAMTGPVTHRASATAGDLHATLVLVGADLSRDYTVLDAALVAVVDEIGRPS